MDTVHPDLYQLYHHSQLDEDARIEQDESYEAVGHLQYNFFHSFLSPYDSSSWLEIFLYFIFSVQMSAGWAVDGPLFKMTKKKGMNGANQPRSDREDDKDEL